MSGETWETLCHLTEELIDHFVKVIRTIEYHVLRHLPKQEMNNWVSWGEGPWYNWSRWGIYYELQIREAGSFDYSELKKRKKNKK